MESIYQQIIDKYGNEETRLFKGTHLVIYVDPETGEVYYKSWYRLKSYRTIKGELISVMALNMSLHHI